MGYVIVFHEWKQIFKTCVYEAGINLSFRFTCMIVLNIFLLISFMFVVHFDSVNHSVFYDNYFQNFEQG